MLAFDRALIDHDSIVFDRASARSFDAFGRMHVEKCRISKANVCPYYGREIPNGKALGLDPNKVYMLYRDPAELEKAAPSFRNAQLLMKHVRVDAKDAKTPITIGTVGSGISFDGMYLVADQLSVWTNEGIALIESKEQSELSSSYGYKADMTPGVTSEGVAYDGVMRDIMANHVALVKSGRAGPDVLVNDSQLPELPAMFKRPNLLAQMIAAGLLAAPADDAAKLALDSKLADMTAKDAEPEEMEDDPDQPGKKRKKMNPGKGEAGKVGGALASDEAIENAIKAKGYITTEAAQKLANDAATRASTEAVSRINALNLAREIVKPLVGVVAMDSAEEVYKFALDQNKVALDGVHPSAYPALVAQVIQRKTTVPLVPKQQVTADAQTAAAMALPGLARINVA